ncbi:MAG: DUF559 domain-containing protein [Acidobacteria bacterium]|nr:DUF559 domain-containing protein [Acidobacteriota bacterium]MBK9528210.1 DUF559 domain-containing protein [Acidobacteriota bacterium]
MPKSRQISRRNVLVTIMNNPRDFEIARDSHWYRIPKDSVDKWLVKSWPPEWLAFYQTKVFGKESHSVNYYAKVMDIQEVPRSELFAEHSRGKDPEKIYSKLILGPLQQLPEPIFSRRFRRIVFIPTTWGKFSEAFEINDLYDESPLEDRLWAAFKRFGICAERQEFFEVESEFVALDFAIYCVNGKVNVETDGDTWHSNPEKAAKDRRRDNALVMKGWSILRFGTSEIKERLDDFCLPKIVSQVNSLGGLDDHGLRSGRIDLNDNDAIQPSLF